MLVGSNPVSNRCSIAPRSFLRTTKRLRRHDLPTPLSPMTAHLQQCKQQMQLVFLLLLQTCWVDGGRSAPPPCCTSPGTPTLAASRIGNCLPFSSFEVNFQVAKGSAINQSFSCFAAEPSTSLEVTNAEEERWFTDQRQDRFLATSRQYTSWACIGCLLSSLPCFCAPSPVQ
jgi:hypothetical protein